jgi:transposase
MYYVGIDVAKQHHDALGLDSVGKTVLPHFRFSNTRDGVQQLLIGLEALCEEVCLAMESTGHYWIPGVPPKSCTT